jgi:hypothetical protein
MNPLLWYAIAPLCTIVNVTPAAGPAPKTLGPWRCVIRLVNPAYGSAAQLRYRTSARVTHASRRWRGLPTDLVAHSPCAEDDDDLHLRPRVLNLLATVHDLHVLLRHC